MPTKTLDGKDAVLVSLAMQKEATLKQQAAQAFAADVALVVADLGATGSVSFRVENGAVTAEWPDAPPPAVPANANTEWGGLSQYDRALEARLASLSEPSLCLQCENPLRKGLHTCGKKG